MLVINLWGGPGCGKSTMAARLFADMKRLGVSVELVTEYVKGAVWAGTIESLGQNQPLVFANQYEQLRRLKGSVDVAITDSPLPLVLAYCGAVDTNPELSAVVWHYYNHEFDNVDVYLKRITSLKYDRRGRSETLDEALGIDCWIARQMQLMGRKFDACLTPDDDYGYRGLLSYVVQLAKCCEG